jgi:hypothetical protein
MGKMLRRFELSIILLLPKNNGFLNKFWEFLNKGWREPIAIIIQIFIYNLFIFKNFGEIKGKSS